jgi:acyl-CoA synthetase (AMP-forming)/AMP-acid ligase II
LDVRLDGSVGLPLPGCRLRILDDAGASLPAGQLGELAVSAPFASSGYWDDPEATARAWKDASEGGWYSTGDLAVLSPEGRLTMVGRLSEVINRSGHKIVPAEVERVISAHPDVLECAVVGAPHAQYGEVPWAFVTAKPGRSFDPKALVQHMQGAGLATYKFPTKFIEVREFPRVAGNKIDKRQLLEAHGERGAVSS